MIKRSGNAFSHLEIGQLGEKIAGRFVQAEGGKILYRNFQNKAGGEIDIVAREGKTLCFIEVKTRRGKHSKYRPRDAVNAKKRELLIRAGQYWIKCLNDQPASWRYDIIEVILIEDKKPEINWLKQAFTEQGEKKR